MSLFSALQNSQLKRQMGTEGRQAHTLFGVAAAFVIGHLLRNILNLHEIFFDPDGHEEGCASKWPLWTMVGGIYSHVRQKS